ncbi:hypothetical protein GR925_36675 [Streptomyces sp. HUCO-GS316]|nr:hypothetical protein [Streptomyces sp. HUCO-GS316]
MAGEGVLAGEVGDGPLPEGGQVGLDIGGEVIDAGGVGVPHVLEGEQVAPGLPQFGQPAHPGDGAERGLASKAPRDRGDARCAAASAIEHRYSG